MSVANNLDFDNPYVLQFCRKKLEGDIGFAQPLESSDKFCLSGMTTTPSSIHELLFVRSRRLNIIAYQGHFQAHACRLWPSFLPLGVTNAEDTFENTAFIQNKQFL